MTPRFIFESVCICLCPKGSDPFLRQCNKRQHDGYRGPDNDAAASRTDCRLTKAVFVCTMAGPLLASLPKAVVLFLGFAVGLGIAVGTRSTAGVTSVLLAYRRAGQGGVSPPPDFKMAAGGHHIRAGKPCEVRPWLLKSLDTVRKLS